MSSVPSLRGICPTFARRAALPALAALALHVVAVPLAHASVIGILGNFDVTNDTGKDAHGFEIDLEDVRSSDVTDTFGGAGRGFPSGTGFDPSTAVVRYGAPSVTEQLVNGVYHTYVRYQSQYDAASQTWASDCDGR